jgi:hypothetical protein
LEGFKAKKKKKKKAVLTGAFAASRRALIEVTSGSSKVIMPIFQHHISLSLPSLSKRPATRGACLAATLSSHVALHGPWRPNLPS